MADFKKAFDRMLANEGGFSLSDVKFDMGGQTYAGISRRFWPDWQGWPLVDAGRLGYPGLHEMVEDFYREHFWEPVQGDALIEQRVAESVFDFAVNAGLKTSIKMAQGVAGAKQDGIFGSKTLLAVNALREDEFLLRFAMAKIARYAEICNSDRSQCKFLLGWINRVLAETMEA